MDLSLCTKFNHGDQQEVHSKYCDGFLQAFGEQRTMDVHPKENRSSR